MAHGAWTKKAREGKGLGVALKELRKRMHFTQEQMAKKLGASVSSIWNWESGRAQPNPRAAQRIRTFVGVASAAKVHKESKEKPRDVDELGEPLGDEEPSVVAGTVAFYGGKAETTPANGVGAVYSAILHKEAGAQIVRASFVKALSDVLIHPGTQERALALVQNAMAYGASLRALADLLEALGGDGKRLNSYGLFLEPKAKL